LDKKKKGKTVGLQNKRVCNQQTIKIVAYFIVDCFAKTIFAKEREGYKWK